mmetsp:Transcript_20718/g.43998  ORF Transcript_20718/g.43998 Transcript_20718/m.43998 type:complete len:317 (-) Transcript_20718:231-1181(-)
MTSSCSLNSFRVMIPSRLVSNNVTALSMSSSLSSMLSARRASFSALLVTWPVPSLSIIEKIAVAISSGVCSSAGSSIPVRNSSNEMLPSPSMSISAYRRSSSSSSSEIPRLDMSDESSARSMEPLPSLSKQSNACRSSASLTGSMACSALSAISSAVRFPDCFLVSTLACVAMRCSVLRKRRRFSVFISCSTASMHELSFICSTEMTIVRRGRRADGPAMTTSKTGIMESAISYMSLGRIRSTVHPMARMTAPVSICTLTVKRSHSGPCLPPQKSCSCLLAVEDTFSRSYGGGPASEIAYLSSSDARRMPSTVSSG